ncbi:GntR family transcriptional regulator [Bradyrhizobium sp. CB82]|uniref:GntR family transcriptional regulator n=1 Tax=Bradyrhizobium sp. CB82 TaxID=3039159 RepID=UPI0024B0AA64|nr:GntR family transcriptional regulator [Bradyrhizobium sp. CB82]WFU43349.1 GntR family transcriptional regulator [Bradyrhizobium sp. CB82]
MPKLSRNTLTSDAYDMVRSMLLDDSRFQPGQKLSVEMISRELGVSRSPVWSAIARLDAEGLVDVSPRQGVYLVAFDEEHLSALFETREALEGMATRLAALRMSDEELSALAATMKHQKTLLTEKFEREFAASALRFHEQILRGARSPLIERQLNGIYARTSAMCRGRTGPRTAKVLTDNFKDHNEITKAVRERDEDTAEVLARMHVQRLRAALLNSAVHSKNNKVSSAPPIASGAARRGYRPTDRK